jgi:hypothetical protein
MTVDFLHLESMQYKCRKLFDIVIFLGMSSKKTIGSENFLPQTLLAEQQDS